MAARVPLAELNPRRIALIKPSALGDIMHALPVLAALRQRFPEAHISWVVNRLYEPLLLHHPHLDATVCFDRGRMKKNGLVRGTLGFFGFLSSLKRECFDLAIDLQGLFRSGLMTFATRAPRRIGLGSAREGARWFYTDVIEDGGLLHAHAVDRYCRVVEALGVQAPRRFLLPVDEAASAWAFQLLRELPRPWLAVGVGARWLTKRWLPEHFAALIRQAQDRFGGSAIFVGAPDEADLSRQAAALIPGPVRDLTGKTTLPELAALLHHADAMLANDTGPLHLAVALGRPVVAPYTCTQTRLTGPYGPEHRAVETNVSCKGSRLKECARLDCMRELTPARLWPALEEVLNQWQTRRQSA